MPEPPLEFGPERRLEGPAKLSGHAQYTADLDARGSLEVAFARSMETHAIIDAVDVRAALDVPGVRLVLTGEDVRGLRAGRMLLDQPLLASERVRFPGERIAVVAAETRRSAEEAARRIAAQTRPLPPVLDALGALAPAAPLLHPDAADYRYLAGVRSAVTHPNVQGEVQLEHHADRLQDAFAAAAHVFEHEFTAPREHQGYLEPHATLVEPQAEGRLRVRSSNKHPFLLRAQLAASLGLPAERFIVESPHIGGDFGGKGMPFDEPICCLIALRTGRPVRCMMNYEDELRATNPRQATHLRLRTAVDAQGRLSAHDARVIFDGGAYAAGTPMPTMVAGGSLSTLTAYHIPAARIRLQQVYTTTVPTGHMRAPGEIQTQFASEHHLDLIAKALGSDRLGFRRRHAARGRQLGAGGERFHHPRAVAVLDELEKQRAARPLGRPGLGRRRGRGFALSAREMHGGACGVRLSVRQDGRVELLTAQPDQGGGSHSALQRVAARALGVTLDDVVVCQGNTDSAPFDMGSAASRVTWVAGGAVQQSADELKTRLERAAASALAQDCVELRDGAFHSQGAPPEPFRTLATRLAGRSTLTVDVSHDGGHAPVEHGHTELSTDYCFSGYLIDVEVDPATGAIALLDATLIADVGTIINPIAHQGQLQGGFAMGVGAALMEELQVKAGHVTTLTLTHYKLPTSLDVPTLRVVLLEPDDGPGPFGAKSAGELSTSGVAPAIANAIADACDVELRDLPLTAERVHRAITAAARLD